MRRRPLNFPPNTLSQSYPRSLRVPHTPTRPAATCKGSKLTLEDRARMGACRAASDISAPGDPCRPRADHHGVVSRFNSRSKREMHGRWWVHGSKGGSLPFRLRVPRNAGSAAAGCMNKTWHCHGAAKAASEIKTQEREASPSRPLFVFRLRPCIAEPVVDRARADAVFEIVIRASPHARPRPQD